MTPLFRASLLVMLVGISARNWLLMLVRRSVWYWYRVGGNRVHGGPENSLLPYNVIGPKITMNFTVHCELTPSTPAVPNCCCSKDPAPYWSNPPFVISDIWALWRSVLSARVPKCQKLQM